jgi:hypothetical protein
VGVCLAGVLCSDVRTHCICPAADFCIGVTAVSLQSRDVSAWSGWPGVAGAFPFWPHSHGPVLNHRHLSPVRHGFKRVADRSVSASSRTGTATGHGYQSTHHPSSPNSFAAPLFGGGEVRCARPSDTVPTRLPCS